MVADATVIALKLKIAANDLDAVFTELQQLLVSDYALLFNDLISIQARYRENEAQELKGLLDPADSDRARSRTIEELIHLVDQIPTQEDMASPTGSPASSGKICHNIPDRLPLQLATKCIVKIAENESLLKAEVGDVIEDIEIAQVMEVTITDEDEGENFKITSPNTAEQYLKSGRLTKWIFHVTPLKLGSHTLYLQVSTIEIIDGIERRRNTVLERELEVAAFESTEDNATPTWEDTGIVVATGARANEKSNSSPSAAPSQAPAPAVKASAPPAQVPAPAPAPSRASPPKSSVRLIRKFMPIAAALLVLFIGYRFATNYDGMPIDVKDGVSGESSGVDRGNEVILPSPSPSPVSPPPVVKDNLTMEDMPGMYAPVIFDNSSAQVTSTSTVAVGDTAFVTILASPRATASLSFFINSVKLDASKLYVDKGLKIPFVARNSAISFSIKNERFPESLYILRVPGNHNYTWDLR